MKVRNLILVLAAAGVLAAQSGDADVRLQRAIRKESVEGDLKGAIDAYKKLAQGRDRAVAAKALLRLGECYEKQGDAEARKAYERLVKEFADQKDQARDAQVRLAAMGQTAGGGKNMVAELIVRARYQNADGRVTPDGKLYHFLDRETGDIAVRDLHTGAVRRLTNEGTMGRPTEVRGSNTPIPSRDGKQIAYIWKPDLGPRELRVINLDGSGIRTVLRYDMKSGPIRIWDWSPNGKSILAAGSGASWWGMAAIDLGSGEAHALRPSTDSRVSGEDFDVAGYSPDGRWVVYSRQAVWDSPDWDIFAIDTQTGRETAVVTGAGADRRPMWVPDSDKIVFRSDRNGKNAIWMVRFRDGQAAGAPILVKPDAGDYDPQGITRDGSLFYALSHRFDNVYQATVDAQTLRAQDAPARLVETYLGHNRQPSWSPSGDSFAYFSERDKISRLVVHHPGGKETVVADPIRWPSSLFWCGTGEGLTSWGTPGPFRIRIFDARTGDASVPDVNLKGLRAPFQLGLSPDCKAVYVSSNLLASKQRRIFRYDVSTGKETNLLTDAGGWTPFPSVSPDGRWLALHGKLESGKESGILLLSTAGGPLRMLAQGEFWYHSWTPDSKRLMYVQSVKRPDGQGTENEIYWVPVEGGAPQPTGIRMPGAAAPSLHPDGKRLLFSASESTHELWVLRNLPLK